MKSVSRMLIVGGVVLLLFAVFMDTAVNTSGGKITNLSLVARQQQLLMLGGISVIAGILLFGIRKLKQTPQDEAREQEEKLQAQQAMNSRVRGAMEVSQVNLRKLSKGLELQLDDQPSKRLAAGAVSGLWLGTVGGFLTSSATAGAALLAAAVLYSIWEVDLGRTRVRLFLVCLMVAVIVAAIAAFGTAFIFFGEESPEERVGWVGAVLLPAIAIAPAVAWFLAYRWAKRQAEYVDAKDPVA